MDRSGAISAFDPRWVLAVRAAEALEGGRAAILTPAARARVQRAAGALGLRPFDASLVIAIVQDAARRGVGPLGGDTPSRLSLVPGPHASRRERPILRVVIVGAITIAWWILVARWLQS